MIVVATRIEPPGADLTVWHIVPIVALLVGLVIALLVSFRYGFDVTDEAWYLYCFSKERFSNLLFIDPIAGTIGAPFDNNILAWRYIGFGLLLLGAAIFSLGLHRFIELLRPEAVPANNMSRLALFIAVFTGALAYYSYGPPTFSYRLISSAGILGAFGSLMLSVVTKRATSRHCWLMIASLWTTLMLAGRISVIVTYPLAAMALLLLYLRLAGLRATAQIIMLYCLYVLVWSAILAFGLGISDRLASIAIDRYIKSGIGTHPADVILPQHFHDLIGLPVKSAMLAGKAVLWTSAATLLALVILLLARKSPSRSLLQLFAKFLALAAALMPISIVFSYVEQWPTFVASADHDCGTIDMIVCQGPTPAFGGSVFMDVAGAQLLCLLIVLVADRLVFAKTEKLRPDKPVQRGAFSVWLTMLSFLVVVTPASSFYTNVGWFYHSVLSLGPLFAAIYVGFAFIPLRTIALPSWLVPLSLVLMIGVVSIVDVHNRFLFLHRVEGNVWAQTALLDKPPELRGVRVNPKLANLFKNIRSVIDQNGFDHNRDVVVAPYNMPGVVIAANVRTLGQSWLNCCGGYGIDEANCNLISHDPTDLNALRRIFVISNIALSPTLKNCLRKRGVEFDKAVIVSTIAIDPSRKIDVSVVPVSAKPN